MEIHGVGLTKPKRGRLLALKEDWRIQDISYHAEDIVFGFERLDL